MAGMVPIVLLWFRRDLRLADNPALRAAMTDGARILPVYVLDTEAADRWAPSGAQRGAALILRRGKAEQVLPALAKQVGATAAYAAGCVEPWAGRQQRRVEKTLAEQHVRLKLPLGNFLSDSAAIRTGSGGAFRLYTPFARACRAQGGMPSPEPAPRAIPGVEARSDPLKAWHLLPTRPDWADGLHIRGRWSILPKAAPAHWPPSGA